jgi:hypothetical protein
MCRIRILLYLDVTCVSMVRVSFKLHKIAKVTDHAISANVLVVSAISMYIDVY